MSRTRRLGLLHRSDGRAIGSDFGLATPFGVAKDPFRRSGSFLRAAKAQNPNQIVPGGRLVRIIP